MLCYDVERLEPKTHVGLDPGEPVEYTKHRVSLEVHPWFGCHPIRKLVVNIVFGQTKQKRGLEQCWSSEPGKLPLSRKDWPAPQGHSGCKTLQMWMARTSQPPHKCLTWTPRWTQEEAMPLVEWALTLIGHRDPTEEYANVIASTSYLDILCFITGPPLARLPKAIKSCSTFLRRNAQYRFSGPRRGRAGIPGCPPGEKKRKVLWPGL